MRGLRKAVVSCDESGSGSVGFELMWWLEPGKRHHRVQTSTSHLNKGCLSSCRLSQSVLFVLEKECCNNPMVFLSAASVGHHSRTPEVGRRAVVRGP